MLCHWYCQTCDSKVCKIIPNIVSVRDKVQYLEEIKKDINEITNKSAAEYNKLRTEMDNHLCALSYKMDNVTKKLSEQVKTDIQSTESSDIIKKQVDESLITVADNLQEVKQSLRETTEKA